jgi:hypothetical protein
MSSLALLLSFLLHLTVCFALRPVADKDHPLLRGHVVELSGGHMGLTRSHASPCPSWPRRFSIRFNLTSIIIFRRTTAGRWWYDADEDREVIYLEDGRGDDICGSIKPFSAQACKQIYTHGNRYVVYPDTDECCWCCSSSSSSCSILSPYWLDDARYLDEETVEGHQTHKWFTRRGAIATLYWSTVDESIPVELDQFPRSFQSFDPATFDTSSLDPDLFVIPKHCPRCPYFSSCTLR